MRVVIADDHPLIRWGIKTSLRNQAKHTVVAEAASGEGALKAVLDHRPDLLILDVSMPGMPSDEVVRQARAGCPGLKTLIFTASDEESSYRKFSGLGISGYILKDEASENLLQAIRVIEQGGAWFSQSIANKFMAFSRAKTAALEPLFNAREKCVVGYIARGDDNRVIALELDLATQTVRNYIRQIYEKMGVRSRVQAALWARENQLTWEELVSHN